jgi:DNA adenine methylase
MAKQTTSSFLNAKPFLKWAGGKSQLLSQLNELLPDGVYDKEFTYIEPFVEECAIYFIKNYKNH